MNKPELRDIHLPDSNLWWPPAPGWWISALLILALVLLLPRLWRWWRHQPARRLALRELQDIRLAYQQDHSDRQALNAIAALLRRVTISYFGRSAQAATTGAEWQAQLQRLAPQAGFSQAQLELLTSSRYRADVVADIDALTRACERWLRALPRSKSHVSA